MREDEREQECGGGEADPDREHVRDPVNPSRTATRPPVIRTLPETSSWPRSCGVRTRGRIAPTISPATATSGSVTKKTRAYSVKPCRSPTIVGTAVDTIVLEIDAVNITSSTAPSAHQR